MRHGCQGLHRHSGGRKLCLNSGTRPTGITARVGRDAAAKYQEVEIAQGPGIKAQTVR